MAAKWTEEEDSIILRLRAEGYTAREITGSLNRTYTAVRARIQVLCKDNKNREWTDKDKEILSALKAGGNTNKYIARVLGRTPSAVATYVSRYWHGTMD